MTAWTLDLDGVVWTGSDAIAGSAQAVEQLRTGGHDYLFVTNNSFSTVAQQEQKLQSFGIESTGRVVSSAMAAATLVNPGERVYVLGGGGVEEAVEARGALVAPAEPFDAVVVGLDWSLSYERLIVAVQAVLNGARFIATNTDRTYPTEAGFYPGAGAIVAAVEAATEVSPTIAGKPNDVFAKLVRDLVGDDGIMVGDRPETDGEFASALGYRFGLVLSGVTQKCDLPVEPTPDFVAADLAELVRIQLS